MKQQWPGCLYGFLDLIVGVWLLEVDFNRACPLFGFLYESSLGKIELGFLEVLDVYDEYYVDGQHRKDHKNHIPLGLRYNIFFLDECQLKHG